MTIEKRIIKFWFWLLSAIILLGTVTGCNPYAGIVPATASAEAVAIPPPVAPSPTTPPSCTVSTGYQDGALNLRAGPGMEYAVIEILHEGQRLTMFRAGTWQQVTTGKLTGWVHSHYCEANNEPNTKKTAGHAFSYRLAESVSPKFR